MERALLLNNNALSNIIPRSEQEKKTLTGLFLLRVVRKQFFPRLGLETCLSIFLRFVKATEKSNQHTGRVRTETPRPQSLKFKIVRNNGL